MKLLIVPPTQDPYPNFFCTLNHPQGTLELPRKFGDSCPTRSRVFGRQTDKQTDIHTHTYMYRLHKCISGVFIYHSGMLPWIPGMCFLCCHTIFIGRKERLSRRWLVNSVRSPVKYVSTICFASYYRFPLGLHFLKMATASYLFVLHTGNRSGA